MGLSEEAEMKRVGHGGASRVCGAQNGANSRWSEEAGLGVGEAPDWTKRHQEIKWS